jgi:tetratricopeptide (TPR) repeat protein
MGPVHYYFGEYDDARRIYARLISGSRYAVAWLDNLAAVELAAGQRDRARRYYARAVSIERSAGRSNPERWGQLAASLALEGDLDRAREELDAALAVATLPELLANRGAIRALQGDLEGAEVDLRSALTLAPEQVPAWENLAWVLDRAGHQRLAAGARARASTRACRAPRAYPYGVGTGEVLEWGVGRRLLLRIEGDDLVPALPAYYRQACTRLANGAG